MSKQTENGRNKLRILMLSRDLKSGGGVVDYVSTLMNALCADVDWTHFVIGRRVGETGGFKMLRRMLADYFRFVVKLKSNHFDMVQLNPSFTKRSLFRDLVFARLVSFQGGLPLIVFIHGWDTKTFEWVVNRKWAIWLVGGTFKKASMVLVLGQNFKNRLIRLGLRPDQIKVESTMFSGQEIGALESVVRDLQGSWRVLYLSRVVIEKGIIELLDAIAKLTRGKQNLKLIVAGDGPALVQAKVHARNLGIENSVQFLGYVRDEEKRFVLSSCHIFVLASHGEGCPVSLLEAMASGLAVVATRVGGIPEVMKDPENGILINSIDRDSIASALRELMDNPDRWQRISAENRRGAWQRFESESSSKRVLSIYQFLAK